MKLFIYAMGPIDYWHGWVGLDVIRLLSEALEDNWGHDWLSTLRLAHERRQVVAPYFQQVGWEGDGEWRVAGLPPHDGDFSSQFMISVKQLNNGSVFIAAPYPLSWLEKGFQLETEVADQPPRVAFSVN